MENLYNRRQAKLAMYRLQYEQQQHHQQQQHHVATVRHVDDYDTIDCVSCE